MLFIVSDSDDWVKEYSDICETPVDKENSLNKTESHEKWAHEYLDSAVASTR